MKQQGFTEPIVLESKPQRVVCVSTSTTPLLFEVGASLVGIPTQQFLKHLVITMEKSYNHLCLMILI